MEGTAHQTPASQFSSPGPLIYSRYKDLIGYAFHSVPLSKVTDSKQMLTFHLPQIQKIIHAFLCSSQAWCPCQLPHEEMSDEIPEPSNETFIPLLCVMTSINTLSAHENDGEQVTERFDKSAAKINSSSQRKQ